MLEEGTRERIVRPIFECTEHHQIIATFWSWRTFFRHTYSARHSVLNRQMQMLTVDLKYKTGRLNLEDSMVLAYAVVVYAVMAYITVAYTMMSFTQIQPVWRQHSESEDPIAFFSPLFAVPVNLLYPPHFQIFHVVAWLAEVGRDWLFRLPRPMSNRCPFILACRAFSVSLIHYRPHFLHDIRYRLVFSFCMWCCIWCCIVFL